MEWKKLVPWNWFQKEESATRVPVRSGPGQRVDPWMGLQGEIERVFENAFRRIGGDFGAVVLLRPSVDISEGKDRYTIRVEVPGAERDDVRIAVEDDALIIKGEKRRERETSEEHDHCVERAYGAFERILSLPEDADVDRVNAQFRNGVLKITVPKREGRRSGARNIEIQHG